MSASLSPEAKLDRVADELVAVIQSLRLMSDMQRQQGEQLGQIIALLTPEEAQRPGEDLPQLLAHLCSLVSGVVMEVKQVGTTLEGVAELMPRQMGAAVEAALTGAEKGVRR